MLQNLSIRARLLLLVAIQSTVLSVAFLSMFVVHVDDSSVADTQAQTRRVSAMADSVRSEMSAKWKMGVFDQQLLAQWAREGHDEKILAAVPIVTAWEAVMATSEEGGYEFRTPNFNPRNPNNEPDPIESKALKAFKNDPLLEEFVIVDDVANTMRHFSPIRLEQECMICHGDPKTSMELWGNNKGLDPTGHAMDDYKVGDLHGAFEVIQSMDQTDQRARTAVISGVVLMILILVPSLALFSWLIHRSVVRPLAKTVDAMKSIASGDGDLTLRLHDRGRSEVAMLGHWFNRFAERIEGVVIGISGSAATLGEATGVVLKSAQDVRGSAFQSKSQSTTISSAAEELSITMNNIAISTSEVSDKLARVSMAVSNVDDSIKGIAKNAAEGESVSLAADQVVRQSQAEIRSMSEVTEKIGDIVTAIQDIAEQTNLLALNATIEAARAGESGKGFAVVASEVKALAKQTAMATDHIRDQISQVQDRADQAVRSVDSIKDIVTRVHQLNQTIAASVEEQRQTVATIAVDVDDAAASGKAVSEQIGEVAAASREITESITNVDSELQGTAASAQASLDSGERLLVLARSMQDVVSRFRVSQSANHSITK